MWLPIRLEKSGWNLGHTRLYGPQSSKTVSERALRHTEHATTWSTHSKLLANQQQGGDSLVEVLVEGLHERSRLKMMEELQRFITKDSHEVVKTGGWEKTQESLPVVKPKVTTDNPEVVVCEGADERTLRPKKKVRCTPSSTPRMWETADWSLRSWMRTWHAVCQAIYKVVEGTGMGEHVLQVRGGAQSGKPQKKEVNKKATALWLLKDAKEKEEDYNDPK